ncbi:MAG: DEAD/DEAH box helicase [Planctomycetes bacterium]|nr:DEAD/DEAH box helicase [Planctomycetota bacterium]
MVERFLQQLRTDRGFASRIAHWHVDPAVEGCSADFPDALHTFLVQSLRQRGVMQLYSHQREAFESILAGRNTVVATPTASGKSHCYNLPILSAMLAASESRSLGLSGTGHVVPARTRPSALYLFPTKALSQDQASALNDTLRATGESGPGEKLQHLLDPERLRAAGIAPVGAWTYDGDTPPDVRRRVRESADIIITNPSMLHVAILPNHPRWADFFRRLRFIVVDEVHHYQGVFGASMANVLRRLQRIARHYGAAPVFVFCSATIANAREHCERLVEQPVHLVDRSGAPRGERHHVLLNPPVVNVPLGLRARALDEARNVARELLRLGVPGVVFGRSRSRVEVLTKYLKDAAADLQINPDRVVGYRGGYLPDLRRSIEHGLREGKIALVAATNALELGVDIGSLDAVVMAGYPGSVASYHQQSGRAGRRLGPSVTVMVASSLPLDQYVLQAPEHLFAHLAGPAAVTNPDNLVIATNHLKCAAFELPFTAGENFGKFPHTAEVLEALCTPGGPLLSKAGRTYWMDEAYPAEDVSLDRGDNDTFLVVEMPSGRSLGHVDRSSVMTTLHPQAIYQHQGAQFVITKLDWEGRRAHAERVKVDYWTDAETKTEVQVLSEDVIETRKHVAFGSGDVHVTRIASLWKRVRFYTNENLETGPIDLPPEEMDTTACWLALGPTAVARLRLDDTARAGTLEGTAALLRAVVPALCQQGRSEVRGLGLGYHAHFLGPVVLLLDTVPGGIGLAEQLYAKRDGLLRCAQRVISACPCLHGCPACIGVGLARGPDAKRAVRELLELALQHVDAARAIAPDPVAREVCA